MKHNVADSQIHERFTRGVCRQGLQFIGFIMVSVYWWCVISGDSEVVCSVFAGLQRGPSGTTLEASNAKRAYRILSASHPIVSTRRFSVSSRRSTSWRIMPSSHAVTGAFQGLLWV